MKLPALRAALAQPPAAETGQILPTNSRAHRPVHEFPVTPVPKDITSFTWAYEECCRWARVLPGHRFLLAFEGWEGKLSREYVKDFARMLGFKGWKLVNMVSLEVMDVPADINEADPVVERAVDFGTQIVLSSDDARRGLWAVYRFQTDPVLGTFGPTVDQK